LRKQKSNHKRSIILITGVLLMMVVVLGTHSLSLREQRDLLIQQEEELRFQIEQQEKRGLEIAEYEEFVGTEEHIRQVAEEALGLVDPNAIIFRPYD
jgi:cell division protein DivIC